METPETQDVWVVGAGSPGATPIWFSSPDDPRATPVQIVPADSSGATPVWDAGRDHPDARPVYQVVEPPETVNPDRAT